MRQFLFNAKCSGVTSCQPGTGWVSLVPEGAVGPADSTQALNAHREDSTVSTALTHESERRNTPRSPPEPERPYCKQHFAGAAPGLE